MEFLAKGESFNFDEKTSQPDGSRSFYVGCAWDGDVDLDLVAVPVRGGTVKQSDVLYYGNLTSLDGGLKHSGDALTGDDSDGDDESLVFAANSIPDDVSDIVIGVIAYSVPDMSMASNTKFTLRDGSDVTSPELFQLPMEDPDIDGETVLVACKLTRNGAGWSATSIGDFRTTAAHGTAALKDLVGCAAAA